MHRYKVGDNNNTNLELIKSSQKVPKCRPLGSGEKIFWLSDRAQSAIMAKIKGRCSIEQLKQALTHVQQRHLLLQVRIALDEVQQPWFIEDNGNIPLRIVPRKGEKHWQQELEQELNQPFVFSQAPLVRVVLIHSEDVSELIITSHHSISDGMSMLFLIQDILHVLTTPEICNSFWSLPIIPAMEDLVPSKVATKTTSWQQKSSLSAKLTDPPTQLSNATVEKKSKIAADLNFASLSSEYTSLLISRCRQEQTTVHAAICSAFLLAIAQRNPFEKQQAFQCFSAINIRENLRPAVEGQVGYYAYGTATLSTLTPQGHMWEIARSFKQQLNQGAAPEKVFEDMLNNQKWNTSNSDHTRIKQAISEYLDRCLMVSNLGPVKFSSQFGKLQLQEIYGPIGLPPGKNQGLVRAVTLENQLFLTLVFPNLTTSSSEGADFLETAIQILQDQAEFGTTN